jgi:hypothetical protein
MVTSRSSPFARAAVRPARGFRSSCGLALPGEQGSGLHTRSRERQTCPLAKRSSNHALEACGTISGFDGLLTPSVTLSAETTLVVFGDATREGKVSGERSRIGTPPRERWRTCMQSASAARRRTRSGACTARSEGKAATPSDGSASTSLTARQQKCASRRSSARAPELPIASRSPTCRNRR